MAERTWIRQNIQGAFELLWSCTMEDDLKVGDGECRKQGPKDDTRQISMDPKWLTIWISFEKIGRARHAWIN